jgi:hypothetical protein
MTIEELQTKAEIVKEQCSGWSHTHDGSYEACLAACGYYTIMDEILALQGRVRLVGRPSAYELQIMARESNKDEIL